MPTLYVLIGPAGEDKSAWVRDLMAKRRIAGRRSPALIAPDRPAATASLYSAVDAGRDIVLDAATLSQADRAPWIDGATGYCRMAVVFERPRHGSVRVVEPPAQATEFDIITRFAQP